MSCHHPSELVHAIVHSAEKTVRWCRGCGAVHGFVPFGISTIRVNDWLTPPDAMRWFPAADPASEPTDEADLIYAVVKAAMTWRAVERLYEPNSESDVDTVLARAVDAWIRTLVERVVKE
jgi:hypothetical protein